MSFKIPLASPWLTGVEADFVLNTLTSGWLTQNSKQVKELEESISQYLDENSSSGKTFTLTSNGTTALHLALLSIGIKTGDEVVVADFSYMAVVNSILYCGATPVLVDVDSVDWCIDFDKVLKAISERTKAIIVVDNYGTPVNYAKLRQMLPNHITIIQDAAESFPGPNGNIRNGNQGDISTFSFYANKVFTAGEGGGIFANREKIEKIKILKNQGVEKPGQFEHTVIGYNYRITSLSAAVLAAQWSRKSEILNKLNNVFDMYFKYLNGSNVIYKSNFNSNTNPWLFTIQILNKNSDVSIIREKMTNAGVETRPGFQLASRLPHLKNLVISKEDHPVSVELSKRIISLPTHALLTEPEIKYVTAELSKSIK